MPADAISDKDFHAVANYFLTTRKVLPGASSAWSVVYYPAPSDSYDLLYGGNSVISIDNRNLVITTGDPIYHPGAGTPEAMVPKFATPLPVGTPPGAGAGTGTSLPLGTLAAVVGVAGAIAYGLKKMK